jgi:hypothetical protein
LRLDHVQYHCPVSLLTRLFFYFVAHTASSDILSRTLPLGQFFRHKNLARNAQAGPYSTKEAQPEEDPSVSARLQRLQNNYEDYGMRRTVEGILVVHDHGHPHILMLQIANAFFKL